MSFLGVSVDTQSIRTAATEVRGHMLARLAMDEQPRLEQFVTAATTLGPYDAYKVYSADARRIAEEVRKAHGADGLRYFLHASIMHALADTLASGRFARLSKRVQEQQLGQFRRMVSKVDAGAEWLDLDHDLFHKEFGIASLRLYVAGAQLVDPRCGIPRSLMVRGAPADWLRKIRLIVSLGGFRPYFQIHTHKFMLETFNEEGWNECYRCCADLYDVHPEVLGMYGSSWFYDPVLDAISPRLAYLRSVPQNGGASLLFVAAGGDAINNSVATSPTRKALYDEGKYLPKSYMLIWGKEEQIVWANQVPHSASIAA